MTVSSVLVSSVAGVYTARAMPRRPGSDRLLPLFVRQRRVAGDAVGAGAEPVIRHAASSRASDGTDSSAVSAG